MDALVLLEKYANVDGTTRFYDAAHQVPMDGVVRKDWREAVSVVAPSAAVCRMLEVTGATTLFPVTTHHVTAVGDASRDSTAPAYTHRHRAPRLAGRGGQAGGTRPDE